MARPDLTLYDSVFSSNLPASEKSQLRRWFDSATTTSKRFRPKAQHVSGAISAFRHGTESLGTGALLALLHVEGKTGLDIKGVPADAALGFSSLVGSAFAPDSEVRVDAENIGGTAVGIFGFRMTSKLLVEKRLASGKAIPRHLSYGSTVAGDSDIGAEDDPIIRAAKNL